MKAITCCFFLLLTFSSYACLNEHHVSTSGKTIEQGFWLADSYFNTKHPVGKLQNHLHELRQDTSRDLQKVFENRNSIAVTLIKLGRLNEAEAFLDQLHKQQPADYSVLANLGTLYELQGQNAKALEFINKAIQVNPVSHMGSEWFHVRVLEFKLKNIGPADIATTDILQLGSIRRDVRVVATEINYQLQERMPFTPQPDLAMAKILDEYAGFLADKVSIRGAYLMYDIATVYDPGNVLQLLQKKELLKPYFTRYKQAIPVRKTFYGEPTDEALKFADTTVTTPVHLTAPSVQKRSVMASYPAIFIGALAVIGVMGLLLYRKGKK